MSRPLGVTVIGSFFLLAGIYLCSISTTSLIVPAAMLQLRAAPLVHEVGSASPLLTLFIGIFWALVGWELFRLHDWARVAAQIMFAVGIAWVLPLILLGKTHFGWRLLGVCMQVIFRAVAIFYLFVPSVMGSFRTKEGESNEVS